MPEHQRPNPDSLLQSLRQQEEQEVKGKLKIFLGMCAGVGKTYDMLRAGHEAKAKGIEVVIGFVETHSRKETEALVGGLEAVPRKQIEYKGAVLEEMDLDAILARRPKLALVDELAHTNVEGSRHRKRYQDVLELIDQGIDVYTTVNVQHLESRADTVAQITGSIVRETIPDSVFEVADQVELVDLTQDELLKRLAEGKVYTPERSRRAIQNFFRKGNLTALREMALRLTAERVDKQLRQYMQGQRISGPWKSGERLLIHVDENPDSVRLIRWARRVAQTMNASWIALHVETSRRLGEPDKNQLAKSIKLARELGAEVISTADEDVVAALVRIANEQNVTQVLASKDWGHKAILQRLLTESGNLDLLLLGGKEETEGRTKRLQFPELHSGSSQYLLAAGVVIAVSSVCFFIQDLIGYQTVSLLLLFVVVLLPLRFGAGPVLLAAGLSALLYDFFFLPPLFTFVVRQADDVLMLGAFFIVAAVTGVLTARVRAREKAVRIREERATALFSLTKDLSGSRSQDEVVWAAVDNIRRFFNAETIMYLAQPDGDIFTKAHPQSNLQVDEKEFGVAAWVYWNEKRAGRFTDTLPFTSATYFPLSGPRYPLGVIGVRLPHNDFSLDQETLLENFVNQIASAVEREFLNEIAKRATILEESERLYKTLFDSVSHELRTPIAAIMSATETIMRNKCEKDNDVFAEIHTASERLNRLVENLLDMTRLESGLIKPKLDWCDVRDVVNAAVQKVSEEIGAHSIHVDIPEDFPLLKLDFGLMEQALVNLLYNAILYTPSDTTIHIHVHSSDERVFMNVEDNGPGFPKDSLKKLFDKFYRVPGSKTGGTGLGLSIAKGFVEAQKGIITAENRQEGGARFSIQLPLSAEPVSPTGVSSEQ